MKCASKLVHGGNHLSNLDLTAKIIDGGEPKSYCSALNALHCSASGGVALPTEFGSARITFLSVEQKSRFPVRLKSTGAAPTIYVLWGSFSGPLPTAEKRYPDFSP